ncbi:beta strand repeat-containing protein [Fischerella sp. NIES-3754]|uniref:beta strand repeat-containing protein n=1 Tax=Fischerella sp. NIES-3754 TaxID=1752063 RepID=UPI00072023CE|nr:S-layer family protein [Fischerella sp. NIES-3754]BAU08705.1 filamentous haemagglutinin outer membrane protein [Fischerella sp. NIES-3754]
MLCTKYYLFGNYVALFLPTFIILSFVGEATAQIIPDNSLGTETSVVNPDVINNLPSDRISGGATRGSNLFHSFQEFNVLEGRGAYFSNPNGITNILTRVTGGNPSNILGKLGVLGNANLFLLNPKGIFFGANATLDLNGSFLATTADSFVFDNNFEFSASNPQPPPQLTVNIPIGLRFRDNPGTITVQGKGQGTRRTSDLIDTTDGLRVQSDQSLALIGGDVNLEGATLKTAGGRIELGSVAGDGFVKFTPTNKGFSLEYDGVPNFGNIQLSRKTAVDASGEGGGDIQVRGKRVTLTDGSQIEASTLRSKSGGNLVVNASESLELSGYHISSDGLFFPSGLFSQVYPTATANASNINITTGSLSINNKARIDSGTFGRGNGGGVNINANDTVSLDGKDSLISSNVFFGAVGDTAGININTGSLFVTNGAQIQSGVEGRGNSGTVKIVARDTVSFDGRSEGRFPSSILTTVLDRGRGNSGGIDVTTGSLFLTNGAELDSNTRGRGNAGNIFINAQNQVYLSNSFINNKVSEGRGVGNSGDIKITTGSLILKDGAALIADTENRGNAGNIIIEARDSVILEGERSIGRGRKVPSQITTTVEPKAVGEGGDISISAGLLLLKEGTIINSSTYGQGNAGNIYITTGLLSLAKGSELSSSTFGQGDAGNIKVNANSLVLDGARLSTRSDVENQQAGNIEVTTAKDIELDNGALITAETKGGQGNINLRSRDLFLRRNSNITTNATGTATGGNINIQTGNLVALENSDISANAEESFGGRVIIKAASIFGTEFRPQRTPESDITASSDLGPDFSGTVEIDTADVDPSQGLVELPENFTDPTDQIAENPCQKGSGSSFIVTGRGGLPSSPNNNLSGDNIHVDLVEPVASNSNSPNLTIKQSQLIQPTTRNIVPAQGWVFNKKGEVVLTAYDPTASSLGRTSQATGACSSVNSHQLSVISYQLPN